MLWSFKVSHCPENFGRGLGQATLEWSHYEPNHRY